MRRKTSKLLRQLRGNAPSTLPDDMVLDYVHNLLVGVPIERVALVTVRIESVADDELVVKLVQRELEAPGDSTFDLSHTRNRTLLSEYIDRAAGELRTPSPLAQPLTTNLHWFADSVGLDAVERAVLQFVLLVEGHKRLATFISFWGELTTHQLIPLIARACAVPAEAPMEGHR